MRKIDFIIIHCSATKADQDIGLNDIDRWHRAKGWLSCGYHYVIRRDGTVEEGRKEKEAGAHCAGKNAHSIGICLVGGLAEDNKTPEANYTQAQMDALFDLTEHLKFRYPQAEVKGHNDFTSKKTCPNFDVSAWWNRRREDGGILRDMLLDESKFYPKKWSV